MDFENEENKKEEDKKKREERAKIEDYYGIERLTKHRRNSDKIRYAVLTPSMFDDYEVIALLEHTPAYNRPANFNERLKKVSESSFYPESKPNSSDNYNRSNNQPASPRNNYNTANDENDNNNGNVISFF